MRYWESLQAYLLPTNKCYLNNHDYEGIQNVIVESKNRQGIKFCSNDLTGLEIKNICNMGTNGFPDMYNQSLRAGKP